MSILDDIVTARPRPLPVFVLADTSQSMRGVKLDALNAALNDMRDTFADLAGAKSDISMAVITFGGAEANLAVPLSPAADIKLPVLTASGRTPMGSAFRLLRELVDDQAVVLQRAYAPTIVLVSDGLPTDIPLDLKESARARTASRADFAAWPELADLHTAPRIARGIRLAVGIGDDANFEMLHAFINTADTPVIRATEADTLQKFIRWVTISVTSRSVSSNPNEAFLAAMNAFDADEILR